MRTTVAAMVACFVCLMMLALMPVAAQQSDFVQSRSARFHRHGSRAIPNAANSSPARVSEAITAGASTINDARATFSNFGSVVDIFAPGQGIVSAFNTSDTATATLSGTSMATPHVTGVVARFLQANPGASPAQTRNELVNNATLNHLSGIPSGTANRLLFWSSAR